MSSSVAWVRALIGLKERLPQALSQISERTSSSTKDRSPASTSMSAIDWIRSDRLPSSSPTENLRAFDVADDSGTLDVRGGIDDASNDAARLDTLGKPAPWVHAVQRAPFPATRQPPGSTTRGCRSGSAAPVSRRERGSASRRPRPRAGAPSPPGPRDRAYRRRGCPRWPESHRRRVPCHRSSRARSPRLRMASRCGPRATSVTSWPASASFTPSMPPMAPAPTTQIFIRPSISGVRSAGLPPECAKPCSGTRASRGPPRRGRLEPVTGGASGYPFGAHRGSTSQGNFEQGRQLENLVRHFKGLRQA